MKPLLLLVTLIPLPLAGQETLSLADAAHAALRHNQTLAAAGAARQGAEARITAARAGFLPKVDYSESFTRSNNPVYVFSSLLTQHQFNEANFNIGPLNRPDFLNNFQSLVTADQPLFDAGRTRRAVDSAQLGHTAAREQIRRAEADVLAGVTRAYFDVQLAAAQLAITGQARESADSDLGRARARVEAGMATDGDVLSLRVHLSEVEGERIRRRADLEVAQATLNDALGLPLDTPHTLSTALIPLPETPPDGLAHLEQQSLDLRAEARQARLATEAATLGAADARSAYLPTVNLHGAFEADRQRFVNRGGANWLVSINLRWNLFNGRADQARIAESRAAVTQAAAERQRAESAIRLQVRRAYALLTAARERLETARAAVTAAEETLRISQNRYAAGLSTVTDLLRTETALLATRTRYLAAVAEQRLAAAGLAHAAGTLTADSEVLR